MTIAVLNTKTSEIENEIPDVSGLVTNAVLTTIIGEVVNKIPDASKLVKKADDAKITDIEVKYFTTADYKTFTTEILDTKIVQ